MYNTLGSDTEMVPADSNSLRSNSYHSASSDNVNHRHHSDRIQKHPQQRHLEKAKSTSASSHNSNHSAAGMYNLLKSKRKKEKFPQNEHKSMYFIQSSCTNCINIQKNLILRCIPNLRTIMKLKNTQNRKKEALKSTNPKISPHTTI